MSCPVGASLVFFLVGDGTVVTVEMFLSGSRLVADRKVGQGLMRMGRERVACAAFAVFTFTRVATAASRVDSIGGRVKNSCLH